MIYSGVDLIRNADRQQLQADKWAPPPEVTPTRASSNATGGEGDPDQQGALLRFARFLNKERQKKPTGEKPAKHPYIALYQRHLRPEERGQMLDIYI